MIRSWPSSAIAAQSIPRESGDDPFGLDVSVKWALYSPRERG